MLLWIGISLLLPGEAGKSNLKAEGTLWGAIKTILIADFVMSLDNVIAIAGVAHGTEYQLFYVIFALLLSVPIIIWGSTVILKVLDRFPIVVLIGAGWFGWIAGGMLVTDEFIIAHYCEVTRSVHFGAEIVWGLIVMVFGR